MSSGGSALAQPGDGPGQQDSWSRRFLTRLEFAGTAGPRSGKPVADRVSAFNVAAGSVTAQVRGSHVRPYDVWVEVPVFRPAQWERTERAMAADPEVCARLREGDVPLRIEELFTRVGLPLLPEARELEMECSCPQWAVPCRHIVAVLHVLADTFDTDPFTVLAWRGRGRARLIQHVEALTASGAPAISPDGPPAVPRARQETAVPGPAVTDDASLATCPRTYWGFPPGGLPLLYAYCNATVPRIQVILRKAYGGAYIVMDSRSVGADLSYAWPANEVAVMGAEGAANVIFRRQITEADDPDAMRTRMVKEYRAELMHPYYAAERGLVDDVIDPTDTRSVLAHALAVLRTKNVALPPRKHGNQPV